jgi:hypothetical protein
MDQIVKSLNARIFSREKSDHYVEPAWCSARLFDVEKFERSIIDPACGWGTIVIEAKKAGYNAAGFDLVDRGWDSSKTPFDFLKSTTVFDNIVTNPPFDIGPQFITHAVNHVRYKVAAIFLVRRLPAAAWLQNLPLAKILMLTPRPSMPSGSFIKAGGKIGGGTQDFCWLIFDHQYRGQPVIGWLPKIARLAAV